MHILSVRKLIQLSNHRLWGGKLLGAVTMRIKYPGPVYHGHYANSDFVWTYLGLDI